MIGPEGTPSYDDDDDDDDDDIDDDDDGSEEKRVVRAMRYEVTMFNVCTLIHFLGDTLYM